MAKNAKDVQVVTLGRNFLNVARLGKFVSSGDAKKQLSSAALLDVEENLGLLKAYSAVEVNAVGDDDGLVICHFRIRGRLLYQMKVPASCLTAIKPVVSKTMAPTSPFCELDRLTACV